MVKYVRDILPLQELELQDAKPGRYPTHARLGDQNRRGDNPVFFDDTQTILFLNKTFVSFPTTLPVSSSYLANDLMSTITIANSAVTKNGINQFVSLKQQTETYTPFTEFKNLGSEILDSFASGSDVSILGQGFSNRLRDKTVLKIALPIKTGVKLTASGGYYYNASTQTFDPIAIVSAPLPPTTFFASTFGAPLLFNCLGIQQSRNFVNTSGLTQLQSNYVWGTDSSYSLLTNIAYAATGTINCSNIIQTSKKFVLEKAVLDIPITANSGWLNDSTSQYIFVDVLNPPIQYIGGPAITVGLLNQIRPGKRDLIMSSTIIPANDLTSWYNYMWSPNGFVDAQMFRGLGGFVTWATPGAVISGSGTFTGSVSLKMTSAIANGLTLAGTAYPFSINSVNLFGRGMTGESGRSIFGKEYSAPQNVSTATGSYLYNTPFTSFIPTTAVTQQRIINLDVSTPSPYLLRNTDNLVVYITSPSPALSGSLVNSVTASYDVYIPTGTIYLTLFGSEIAENVEFHDTLNQRLETNQIHESLGVEATTDQFDVFYSSELSGSRSGKFTVAKTVPYFGYGSVLKLTGSLETDRYFDNFSSQGDSFSWSTQYSWSTYKKISELRQLNRNIDCFSVDEKIADTRIPNPKSALQICNSNFIVKDNLTYLSPLRLIYAGKTGSFSSNDKGHGAEDWFLSYPFEAKYSSVPSLFANSLKPDQWFVGRNYTTVEYDTFSIELGDSSNRVLYSEGSSYSPLGMGIPEFIKVFYGFGDGISTDCNQYVIPRGYTAGTTFFAGADIRGWRHGLYSAFPSSPKAVFKRNSYGQFRDMLEQRIDTRFYDSTGLLQAAVKVKFVNSDGSSTLPEYTFSSNLSTEATSSLPYFDGKVRNREEPISFALSNQNIVVS